MNFDSMPTSPFNDKVVVVTGAASGIGWAISNAFAVSGAKLGMLDVDGDAVTAKAADLVRSGAQAIGIRCDVSEEKECYAAVNRISATYGGIDVLVNNAGITQRSIVRETDTSVYRKVMDINFFGSLYCTKAAIESIISRKGLVIALESLAGVTPLLGRSGYCASKHAMHGFFTTLRAEIASSGARVMIVCPGFIKTNLQTRALGGDGQVTSRPQSTVGKQDTPESAAEEIYRAAVAGKKMLVLTPMGKIGYWVSRLAPLLYEKLMARQFKTELERGA